VNLHRSIAVPAAFLSLFCAVPFVIGCGGDSASSAPAGTSRAYTSTVPLSGGQTGVLAMNVASSGAATGTLTVNSATQAASLLASRAVVATVSLTGTVSSAGVVSLTGHYADSEGVTQNVTVGGSVASLTSGVAGGSLALGIFNQTFNGAWTLTATVSPGGGTASTATFSAPSSTNATTTDLTLNLVAGVSSNLPIIGKSLTFTANTSANAYNRYITFGVLGNYTVGQAIPIDGNAASVSYIQDGAAGKQWQADGGTLEIVSVTSSKITFRIVNATMKPVASGATGAFTLNYNGETTALVTQ